LRSANRGGTVSLDHLEKKGRGSKQKNSFLTSGKAEGRGVDRLAQKPPVSAERVGVEREKGKKGDRKQRYVGGGGLTV